MKVIRMTDKKTNSAESDILLPEEEGLSFKTEVYEGPLDLLLALIAKNKVDICDIPIALILDQYLEYLDRMRRMDMEIASDFIVMVAELMVIKSRMLLPRREEEEEDPRARLAEALLEYKRAKEAEPQLRRRYDIFSGRMVKDEMEIAPEKADLSGLDLSLLEEAFARMMRREQMKKDETPGTFRPLIQYRIVPVEDKIGEIEHLLRTGGRMRFREIILLSRTRSEAIASFLALLEMIKSGLILMETGEDEKQEDITFILNPEGERINGDETDPRIDD